MKYLLLFLVLLAALFSIKATAPARVQADADRTAVLQQTVETSAQRDRSMRVYDGRKPDSIQIVPIPPKGYRMPIVVPDSSIDYSIQIVKPDPGFSSNMPVLIPEGRFLPVEIRFPDSALVDTSFAVPQLKNFTIRHR